MPYLEDRREAHIRNFAYKRSRKENYIDKELKNTSMWKAPVLKRLSSNCIAYDRSIRELTAKAWNPLDDKIRNLETYQGRSLAQIRGGAVPPEQVPGGNFSVTFGDN